MPLPGQHILSWMFYAGDSEKTVAILRTLLLSEATPEMAFYVVSAATSTGLAGSCSLLYHCFSSLSVSFQTCIILRDMRINLTEATVFSQWHREAHVS